jgi:serine/threonine-protein kinase RsbW
VELVRRECIELSYGQRQLMLNVPVALTEALSNAILRGNGDDPAKHVHVRAEVDSERLVVEVADEGEGFDLDASLVDPTIPGNIDREDGRGLFLMRKLMDRVERIEAPHGSVVRMTLHRE